MLPQYIAAIERETGAIVSRLAFGCEDAAQLDKAATRHLSACAAFATLERRAVTYRVFEIRDATLDEIRAHFVCLASSGVLSQDDAAERITRWARRYDGVPC